MSDSNRTQRVRWPVVVAAAVPAAIALFLAASFPWFKPDAKIGESDQARIAPETAFVTETRRVEVAPEPPVGNDSATGAGKPGASCADRVPRPGEPAPPTRVVILPARIRDGDPGAAVFVDAVRRAMLVALQERPDVEVVDASPADLVGVLPAGAGAFGQDRLVYTAVSQRFEATIVAEVSQPSAPNGPNLPLGVLVLKGSGGGRTSATVDMAGSPRPLSDPESVGMSFASSVMRHGADHVSSHATACEARSALLDPTLTEAERVEASSRLRDVDFDSEAIAVAVDLGNRSMSADTRRRAWLWLQQKIYDQALVQPLSYALLSDPDAAVREQAALALAAYNSDGSAASTLAYARDNDPSADVRLAARMAMMGYDEQRAFVRRTLLDTSLTPAERLAPTTTKMIDRLATLDLLLPELHALDTKADGARAEEFLAYAEIAAATDDMALKYEALSQLQGAIFFTLMPPDRTHLDRKIVDVLIDSVAVNDDRVRETALRVLSRDADNPAVRPTLERVLEQDPELAGKLRITEALARTPRTAQSPSSSL